MIAFSLACYASVTGRMEEAKERLQRAIKLDKDIRGFARQHLFCQMRQKSTSERTPVFVAWLSR